MLDQLRTADILQEQIEKINFEHIPVLTHSINAIRKICADENAPLENIANTINLDPGLVIHLLRSCNKQSTSSLRTEITSISQTLMMLGTQQVSQIPVKLPSIEKILKEPAKTRLLITFERAYHAARQASEWARQRHDMNPDEVFVATQIHFLAEMVLAIQSPDKLMEIDYLRCHRKIASEEAQYIILGFTLDQMSYELAKKWELPSLATEALKPENAKLPRSYGIMLAVQLARGTAIEWQGEKADIIQQQVADWLERPLHEIVTESHKLAVEVAHETHFYGVVPAATWLPLITETNTAQTNNQNTNLADICLIPQPPLLKNLLKKIQEIAKAPVTLKELIHLVLQGMHDGIGFNRVIYATLDNETNTIMPYAIKGADNDPGFNRFTIPLHNKKIDKQLFAYLTEKTQAILINDTNREKYWGIIPGKFKTLIKTNSFVAMSIFVEEEFIGMFYADRHTMDCQIDNRSYLFFKALCTHTMKTMGLLASLQLDA